MTEHRFPVLIVGGGGCGLSASAFLSDHGIDSLLIERHASTSRLPKAHYLNQRTMEIFRQHGMAEDLYRVGTPMSTLGTVRWNTTLGGDGPLDGQELFRMDSFGGGALAETYLADSPGPSTNYPQVRLEPLLRTHAEQRSPGRVVFGHELVDFVADDEGVSATVRDREKNQDFTVRAEYLIAADGGKTVGPALGVEMAGPTALVDMINMHFRADLSPWWNGDNLICFFNNVEGAGTWGAGAMAMMGPTWGKHSEEWSITFGRRPDDPERFDEQTVIPKVRSLLKTPDLEVECINLSHWIVEAVIADRMQAGRVFLAGDAAHRHPPTTGLGLNAAVQDSHNLAWKLAAVLKGKAEPALLDTYASERHPGAARNVNWAMFTFMNHAVLDAGLGVIPGAPPEALAHTLTSYLADTEQGATLRARFAEVASTQRAEFQAHDLELGFRYESGALVPDGSSAPAADPMGARYTPTTRPGHRLPHAWVERGGQRLSTHDLVGHPGGFVLITGPDAADRWEKAARSAGEAAGIPLPVIAIGTDECIDADGTWARVREISADGAVLVRPDNHVGWRAMTLTDAPDDELNRALLTCLGR